MYYFIIFFTLIVPGILSTLIENSIRAKTIKLLSFLAKSIIYSMFIFELYVLSNYLRGWKEQAIFSFFDNPTIQLLLKTLLINTVFAVLLPHLFVFIEYLHSYIMRKLNAKH